MKFGGAPYSDCSRVSDIFSTSSIYNWENQDRFVKYWNLKKT